MANVVRFVLESQRNLDVPGAGRFVLGILDVPATNLEAVARVRYLVEPYGAKEYGTVDSASTAPTLPAAALPPAVDPLPMYALDSEVPHLAAQALQTPGTELYTTSRAALQSRWQPNTAYAQGDVVVSPAGQLVKANASFTSGATYSAGNWTATTAGGSATTDASQLTSGTLPAARIGAGSVTPAKLAAGSAVGQALVQTSDGPAWGVVSTVPELRAASGSSWTPTITELAQTIATRSQVGLPTIYVPQIIRVPDAVYAAYPTLGRWRVYTSTDHDNADGGIAVFYTDAIDPTDPAAVWTFYRTPGGSAVIFFDGTGKQTETPWIVYNPVTGLFHLYYQRLHPTTNTTQYTSVATSADGVTNWSTPQIALPNPAGFAPWNHTGYAGVWRIDGRWVAFSLLGSGLVGNSFAWWWSNDGINWVLDRARLWMKMKHLSDGVLNTGMATLLRRGDRMYAIGRLSTPASGSAQSDVSRSFIAPMKTDLTGFEGLPTVLTGSLPSNFAPLPDGRLVGAIRANTSGQTSPATNDFYKLVVFS